MPPQPSTAPQPPIHTSAPAKPEHMSTELYMLLETSDKVKLKAYYQKLIESNADRFDKYCKGRKRPVFRFVNDPRISTAAFAHGQNGRQPEVLISSDFFVKNKLSEPQVLWVMYHELGHFMDYADNKAEYEARFELEKRKGVEMAVRYRVEYNKRVLEYNTDLAANPDKKDLNGKVLIPKREVTKEEEVKIAKMLGGIYRSVYGNSVDDIHVNNRVAATPEFSHDMSKHPQSMQSEVGRLYKEVLFVSNNLTSQGKAVNPYIADNTVPEYMQLTNFLLRGANVTSEDMRVTDGVVEALSRDYALSYKTKTRNWNTGRDVEKDISISLNTEQLISMMLNPNTSDQLQGDMKARTHKLLAPNGKNTNLTYRSHYLDQTLLLTFEDLLWKDIKDKDPEDLMRNAEQVIVMAGKASPDQVIPDEVIEEWADWANGEGSGEVSVGKIAKDFAKRNNIDPDTAERVATAWSDVDEYIKELNQLWKRITSGASHESIIKYGEPRKLGNKLDIKSVVNSWHRINRHEYDDLSIWRQKEMMHSPSDRPERIEISLLMDQSPSMGDAYSDKNKILERVMLMINMSLDNFNEWLLSVRSVSKSKLHVDRELIVYGGVAKRLAQFRYSYDGLEGVRRDQNSGAKGEEDYRVHESVGTVAYGGSTCDAEALKLVMTSADEEDSSRIEKITQGKIMKIVIVITDGESSTDVETKSKIDELVGSGVMVFAFQIGDNTEEEVESFDNVWNSHRDGVKRGYKIGMDFYNLPQVMSQMLAEVLGDVQIYED